MCILLLLFFFFVDLKKVTQEYDANLNTRERERDPTIYVLKSVRVNSPNYSPP
jgi:hypothetical protein